MKQWSREVEINAPIEKVWQLFDGKLENTQKIMPHVIDNDPIRITEEVVGSVYRQRYRDGKHIEEYDVETLEYMNTSHKKKLITEYTIAKTFEIKSLYEFKKVDNSKTMLRYTVINRPLKWYVKFLMLFASDKAVVTFLARVKNVAEAEVAMNG